EAGTRRTHGRWEPTHGEQQEQPSYVTGSASAEAPRGKNHHADLKNPLPTLDIGSHSNATRQTRRTAGAGRTLGGGACTRWVGRGEGGSQPTESSGRNCGL